VSAELAAVAAIVNSRRKSEALTFNGLPDAVDWRAGGGF
jgi:hypothetical protein